MFGYSKFTKHYRLHSVKENKFDQQSSLINALDFVAFDTQSILIYFIVLRVLEDISLNSIKSCLVYPNVTMTS